MANRIARLVGVFAAAMILTLLARSAEPELLHLPSLVWVVGVTSAGMLLSFGPGTIASAFGAALIGQPVANPIALRRHVAVFDRGSELAWVSGLLACVVGMTQMIGCLQMPTDVGMGMATAWVAVLYGAFLAEFILRPFRWALVSASASAPDRSPAEVARGPGTRTFVLIALGLMLATFGLYLWAWGMPLRTPEPPIPWQVFTSAA